MYSILVFSHVISAILLGNFLTLPFALKSLSTQKGSKLTTSLKTILHITRFGHYGLILLLVSGGWMVLGYSSYPSILWVVLSTLTLTFIGACMGIISKWMKLMIDAEKPEEILKGNISQLRIISWLAFSLIIFAVLIMTNRQLFL